MLAILSITTPIFLLIGVGFLARRWNLVSPVQLSGVANFVLYAALPALILGALTRNSLGEVISLPLLAAYALGSVATFVACLWLPRNRQKKSPTERAIQALGMSASNSGFVAYPIAALALGQAAAGIIMVHTMMVEILLVIPGALVLAEVGQQRDTRAGDALRQTLTRLVRNPILISLSLGLALAALGIRLPATLDRTIELLAGAAGPAALFVIGGTLYGLKIRGMVKDMGQIMLGKLVLHPLLVLGMLLAFQAVLAPLPPLIFAGAMIFAACPMISIYPLIAQRFGMEGVGAAALMASTLSSFVTLSVVLWALSHTGLMPLLG
ncbi:AEC family transporter [Halomonas sp. DN3]|uniref:AEC family transporter n=1 Tax=Halomonas sp. DN3 TaxID=2953657 RepID=UPI00209F6632|nr:AEC family transporter [Halomonas sp. DN3]USZ50321.1 AEC family transporter [Halomonas sp. DN3]